MPTASTFLKSEQSRCWLQTVPLQALLRDRLVGDVLDEAATRVQQIDLGLVDV